ncbi:AAA-domain-containing protein [Amylocystis lapponica]|nr:AAA-domain-containing protein [Amylocystis lapponica]
MRSHLLSPRTRSLVKIQPTCHRALLSSTHAVRYPRKDPSGTPSQSASRLSKRSSSSVTPSSVEPDADAPPPVPSPSDPPSEDAEGKPKRRTRISTSTREVDPSVQLPSGLDVLWMPEDDPGEPSSTPPNPALPPPEIFDEILHNLHITLHSQTQHRAAYALQTGSLVEPTFALYCPIEGGDYYLDETVRELARRTGAEVVVIDAVQLAAGESGQFGKAASALRLPNNPLHFPSAPSASARSQVRSVPVNDDEDMDDAPQFMTSQHMTLHVMAPVSSRVGRAFVSPPSSSGSSMSKLKGFFDELVNVAEPADPDAPLDAASTPPSRRPRIVYVRDFPMLAQSSSAWYPALLAAVRQRRRGPISRPTSPVLNPMTMIFGVSPSIAPSSASVPSGANQGLMNLLMARHAASASTSAKSNKPEYGEDSAGDKARERRMLSRMKRWARGDASSQDLPQLSSVGEEEETSGSKGKPNIVLVGGPEGMGLPSIIGSALSGAGSSRSSSGTSDPESRTPFFRTSIVVPSMRSLSHEKNTRMARRREINELAMRMGVAAVGGDLGKMEHPQNISVPSEEGQTGAQSTEARMWEEWGRAVEVWSNVRRMADRAVGSVIALKGPQASPKPTLEPTPIPWSAVHDAWSTDKSAQDLWKSLLLEPPGKILREHEEEDDGKGRRDEDESDVDEVIERVKRDPDLDQHEQRLLGCIVDTASLSTTFNHVHLPAHTIDSVRTIVSLPLLYPNAFQFGILKEHGMTGCLLFGPPGTGKTLVVRALAKEAGCRMLSISPSDVMDMYVGEGEKLVRSVFSLARRLSPCVVFIDELDALFGARVSRESGGGMAHRGVITEFMQEMDGLKSSKEDNVIVIGATNRPFDLDDAVLRRLPRRLLVDLPGEKEREEILKILLRDEKLAEDVDLKTLAKKTESFSGSDLKHLCVSAALDAVKERVNVPWRATAAPLAPEEPPSNLIVQSSTVEAPAQESVVDEELPQDSQSAPAPDAPAETPNPPETRTLGGHNFEKALKEITPSASESLGSLAELRKWNDEFGEGRRDRKKQQVWGKGRFGFVIHTPDSKGEAKVDASAAPGTDTATR